MLVWRWIHFALVGITHQGVEVRAGERLSTDNFFWLPATVSNCHWHVAANFEWFGCKLHKHHRTFKPWANGQLCAWTSEMAQTAQWMIQYVSPAFQWFPMQKSNLTSTDINNIQHQSPSIQCPTSITEVRSNIRSFSSCGALGSQFHFPKRRSTMSLTRFHWGEFTGWSLTLTRSTSHQLGMH